MEPILLESSISTIRGSQQACGPIGKEIGRWSRRVLELEFNSREHRTHMYVKEKSKTKKKLLEEILRISQLSTTGHSRISNGRLAWQCNAHAALSKRRVGLREHGWASMPIIKFNEHESIGPMSLSIICINATWLTCGGIYDGALVYPIVVASLSSPSLPSSPSPSLGVIGALSFGLESFS